MKKQLTLALTLAITSGGIAATLAAQTSSEQRCTLRSPRPTQAERHPVRREFEAIFAKQTSDYKAQFAAVKRGEKLKPTCAPDFVFRRPDGTVVTCAEMTADRQAKFERIKSINYLVIEIGNIELTGDEASLFTTQRFSRVLPDNAGGPDRTIVTEGTVHKEAWVRTPSGWQSKGFQEFKQGTTTVDGQLYQPPVS